MKQKHVALADLQQRHRDLTIEAQKRELEGIETMELMVLTMVINAHAHVQHTNGLYTAFMRLKEEQSKKPKLLLPGSYQ